MKKIGNALYAHCSTDFRESHEEMIQQAKRIMIGADMYNELLGSVIYKMNFRDNVVTFIESEDFDSAREPQVGKAYVVNLNTGKIKTIEPKGQIYHHKWMFVPEDYAGFDIEESKSWSEKWRSVFPVDRKISSRIGYKKYWVEYLKQYGLEIR